MPSKEQNIFKQNILVVLPVRDQLGRRILLLELGSEYFVHGLIVHLARVHVFVCLCVARHNPMMKCMTF